MKTSTPELIDSIFTLWRVMKECMASDTPVNHLTIVQIQTLIFLKQHGEVPMNKIASFLKIELPSTTSLINKLVKEDLVTRSQDIHDRRLVHISLTAKGKQLLSSTVKTRSKKMSKMLEPLSQEDKNQLFMIIHKITDQLQNYEK